MSPTSPRSLVQAESVRTLHAAHWVILAMSIGVTGAAWFVSRAQVQARIEARFEAERGQVIDLLLERMGNYEEALWGGVGAIHVAGSSLTLAQWRSFAGSLSLERRFPGINGIGVIDRVPRARLDEYLRLQREQRPDFSVYPAHEQQECLPITYIEPVATNFKALGLDMAHETNRHAAVLRARDTGVAQITGCIALVQEEARKPGFLFFAPFYRGETPPRNVEERRALFSGVVYAPFVVEKLMRGVLSQAKRVVHVRIEDGPDLLYDEHIEGAAGVDPDPLFRSVAGVELGGRVWRFDVRTTLGFRRAVGNSQPLMILVAGIVIDGMLLLLFLTMARTRAGAERQARDLARSNQELERFTYVASHDLREPLRMVDSYLGVLASRLDGELDEVGQRSLGFARDGATRMKQLLDDLQAYSRAGRDDRPMAPVDLNEIVAESLEDLSVLIGEHDAEVHTSADLPQVQGDRLSLRQLFQNLIGNAIKYRSEEPPRIEIRGRVEGERATISVQDNGMGIALEDHEAIFTPFKRLELRDQVDGSGVGLAICAKVLERHGSHLRVASSRGHGATFSFDLPLSTHGARPR